MPIKIPKDLPAYKLFKEENIFVMHNERADSQDIRPLKIGMLNLMPKKIEYENQILRYLSIFESIKSAFRLSISA